MTSNPNHSGGPPNEEDFSGIYCWKCGTVSPLNADYCTNCGAPIGKYVNTHPLKLIRGIPYHRYSPGHPPKRSRLHTMYFLYVPPLVVLIFFLIKFLIDLINNEPVPPLSTKISGILILSMFIAIYTLYLIKLTRFHNKAEEQYNKTQQENEKH